VCAAPDPNRLVPPAAAGRVAIRSVAPTTPLGGPAKAVVGDPVAVSAELVRDGHGVLAARVRWRRLGASRWSTAAMVERDGRVHGEVVCDEPGFVEFEIQAWLDRVATWRRDLSRRAGAGAELSVEFLVGAELLEERAGALRGRARRRVEEAAAALRSTSCSDAVRLAAGTDDAVADLVSTVPDVVELTTSARFPLRVDRERAVSGAWYEFFPRSEGGFHPGARTWDRLEQIAADGFDVVYLPPVHPIGRTSRKGPNNTLVAGADDVGSPWAVGGAEGGFDAVHPDLGTVADLERFVGRAAELGVEVALDIAFQCSPDHPWVHAHPAWFEHLPDGSVRTAENPPKRYEDIYPIRFWPDREEDRLELWAACREVFATWARRGIRIFRVDNPHTKPLAFWAWVIPSVQLEWPDVVFLAEAFTDPARMHALAEVGFSQSYTYFTWRTTKDELAAYGDELARGPAAAYFRPNFWPTTPDILAGPLRHGSSDAFRLRALLAATMSPSWGIYSGYELCENVPASESNEEFLNSEKYQLVDRDLDLGRDDAASIAGFLALLNGIRREHPSLLRIDSLRFHATESEAVLAYSHHRVTAGSGPDSVLVVANLRPDEVVETTVHVDAGALGVDGRASFTVRDALTGERWTWRAGPNYVRLDPTERVGHVLVVEHG